MDNRILIPTMIITLILFSSAGPFAALLNNPLQKLFGDYSLNWAGYYVSGSSYNYANATWIVPAVLNGTGGYSSAWVGIGGINGSGNLIQAGTEQECLSDITTGDEGKVHGQVLVDMPSSGGNKGGSGSFSGCTPVYYAWWETYPANKEQKIDTIAVSPGDTISAFIQQISPGVWIINITDITKGQSFQTTENFYPDQTTAEAIIERPLLCLETCQLTDLADFGSIRFSGAFAVSTKGDYFDLLPDNTPIKMVDNNSKIMASPTTIVNQGTFDVNGVGKINSIIYV
ncbi:Peptidase A4 family protein [uncultured archaeon]|nr:Peptidase A4 family protein [uncultured archaeon]